MIVNSLIKITKKKSLIKKYFKKNNLLASMPTDMELTNFINTFKQHVHTKPLKEEDWVTHYFADKNTRLKRGTIRALVKDGFVRTNEAGEIAFSDLKRVEEFLNFFGVAIEKEIIKETEITGSKKYLMLDFQKSSAGKSIPVYQMELLYKMFTDFFSNFYEITPKKGVEIPEELKLTETLKR